MTPGVGREDKSVPENQLRKINHIVTLMLENRSFDNILGWLYDPHNDPPFDKVPRGQTFEGVSGKDLSNPRPGGGLVRVGKNTVMTDPFPDPNEPYDHVYAQMYGVNPPPHPIPNTEASPNMQGFVIDYQNAIDQASTPKKGCSRILASLFRGVTPMDYDPGIIMNCFTPKSLPVINGLANAYAVCDYWFSSVPTQTFSQSFVCARGYIFRSRSQLLEDWSARLGYRLPAEQDAHNLQLAFRSQLRLANLLR